VNDLNEIDIVLDDQITRKPNSTRRNITRKIAKHAFDSIGKASQPVTTVFNLLDNAYATFYNKYLRKGPRPNQVDPALDRVSSIEYQPAYPVIPDSNIYQPTPRRTRRNGGKKKRKNKKTQKNRKLR
jgi:hypothetical protein